MSISWGQFTKPDGTSYRQIIVSERSDTNLFRSVAESLEAGISGRWTARSNGPDQRYWDYESNGGKITLHIEHYIGISIFPTDGADADSSSLKLLEEAYRVLANGYA